MSDYSQDETNGPDAVRASRKAERREKQRQRQQAGPVAARYGIWTGEGFLREGESLEKKLAESSLKVEGQTRRSKRRQRKQKKRNK